MIDNKNNTIRDLIFIALKHLPTNAILPLLSDESCVVRCTAARSLYFREDIDVNIFNTIKQLTFDSKHYIREIAAFTLGHLRLDKISLRQESIQLLTRLISDIHIDVRISAVYSLGYLFLDADIPRDIESKLIDMTKGNESAIKKPIIFALSYSTCSYCALDTIYHLSSDRNKYVRDYAKFVMEEIIEDDNCTEEYIEGISYRNPRTNK